MGLNHNPSSRTSLLDMRMSNGRRVGDCGPQCSCKGAGPMDLDDLAATAERLPCSLCSKLTFRFSTFTNRHGDTVVECADCREKAAAMYDQMTQDGAA